jgi:hypothetical protein
MHLVVPVCVRVFCVCECARLVSCADHLQSCYLGMAMRIFLLLRLVSSEQV